MEIIVHRVNTKKNLKKIANNYGIEIDLRAFGDDIILHHEPFIRGESFTSYLSAYQHGTIILNIKSDKIEFKVLDYLKTSNITNYFFLDSSFPTINNLSRMGEKNFALRFSEYEKLDTIMAMQGMVAWVWIDCFTRLPIDNRSFKLLKEAGFKLCLVSPELQGRPEDIEQYKFHLMHQNITLDAVCTDMEYIKEWTD